MKTSDNIQYSDAEMLRLAAYAYARQGQEVPVGWNPLKNDVEAFRLSAILSIGTFFRGISLTAATYARDDWWAEVWYEGDKLAATRLAIVAVAAMMGRHFETLPIDWWKLSPA